MMNKMFSILCSLLIMASCSKSALFDVGSVETREIILPTSIDNIEVRSIFALSVCNDTVNKIIITCGKNIQSFVHASFINGKLKLTHDDKYQWSRDYKKIKIEIHSTTLPRFDVYEPISFTSIDTLKGANFTYVDWGRLSEVNVQLNVQQVQLSMSTTNFGYFKLKGSCDYATIWACGTCVVHADSLLSRQCTVLQRGRGDVYVHPSQSLNATIELSGNVYCYGNPAVVLTATKNATGKIILLK